MRLPLLVAFVLATLVSLVNVSAFKQATVASSLSANVVNTDSAKLAIVSGGPMATVQANGIMKIDFRIGTMQYGYTTPAPNGVSVTADQFDMGDVIRVVNNDTSSHCLSVFVSSGSPTILNSIYARYASQTFPGGTRLAEVGGALYTKLLLGPAGSATDEVQLDFYWRPGTAAFTATPFTIKVQSTQASPCP